MHGISRQTLIYYDKIGLFSPAFVDKKGMRYYNASQIPLLREICMLKQLNVPLKEIQSILHDHDRTSTVKTLEKQIQRVKNLQQQLQAVEQALQNRLELYRHADYKTLTSKRPFLGHLPPRKAWFVPWPREHMDKERLHLCFALAMEQMRPYGLMPNYGIGAQVLWSQLATEEPFQGAGSLFFLPRDFPHMKEILTIPGGDYLCMYICGMPYRLDPLLAFEEEIRRHQIPVTGDIISICLLDSNYHSEMLQEDFCQLQIRIREDAEFDRTYFMQNRDLTV